MQINQDELPAMLAVCISHLLAQTLGGGQGSAVKTRPSEQHTQVKAAR